AGGFYFFQYATLLYERRANNIPIDYVLGAVIFFAVIIGAWRVSGMAVPIVAICFILYALTGKYLPGILHHQGLNFLRILRIAIVEIDGIYGFLPSSGINLVIIFIFFASVVQGFGGLDYIMEVTRSMTKRFSNGVPQVAVISSLIFGLFSGSGTANAAGVGAYTIPLMKKVGVPPAIAGGIEAVASTGGQAMPPVMGVAAFLMADLLGVPYVRIMLVGFIPAFIYYGCVAWGVYLKTKPFAPPPGSVSIEGEAKKLSLAEGIPLVVAIGFLLYLVIGPRLSLLLVGTYTIFAFLAMRLIYDLIFTGRSLKMLMQFGLRIVKGLADGAMSAMTIMVMLGCMAIIVRILVATGITQEITFGMVDFSGGNLFILVLLIGLVALLFGMATSTVVVYLLVVLLGAPTLVKLGIPPIAAHFAVFYLSLISGITPPVAIVVAVTAMIAGASYVKTCLEAMKLGMPLYILPFVFIYSPGIVGDNAGIALLIGLQTVIGIIAVMYGTSGNFKGIPGNVLRVLALATGGLGLFYPVQTVRIGCQVIIVAYVVVMYLASRRKKARLVIA
ncbi:MAG: TRAP transporter fused permease subunit, partial [Dehalococcoidales bacterium]|nr:TRAP transporter fused permease subunit [Dehalococcoidales bacterium]